MIDIMRQLSSYSVQYISEINNSNIIPINWSTIRLGNIEKSYFGLFYIETPTKVIDITGRITEDLNINTSTVAHIQNISQIQNDSLAIKTTVSSVLNSRELETLNNYYPAHQVSVAYPEYDSSVSQYEVYAGKELYLALSDEQKSLIPSIAH